MISPTKPDYTPSQCVKIEGLCVLRKRSLAYTFSLWYQSPHSNLYSSSVPSNNTWTTLWLLSSLTTVNRTHQHATNNHNLKLYKISGPLYFWRCDNKILFLYKPAHCYFPTPCIIIKLTTHLTFPFSSWFYFISLFSS